MDFCRCTTSFSLLVQVSFQSIDEITEWRQSIDFGGAVLLAVLVLASAAMADRLTDGHFGIDIPAKIRERLSDDPTAGVSMAMDLLCGLRKSGAFQGVHLIPGTRYPQVAQELLR
jgi:methylenetetrahydrofolate reductase (NADPH)